MADAPVIRSDFYVYALFRENGETPFYIGKGRGNRMFIHERRAHRFASYKDRIIQKMMAAGIVEVPKAKLIEGLTDAEAKKIECDLIQLIGRCPAGPLANLTSGGDGVVNLSPESRAAKAEKNRLSWQDPERRKKRLLAMSAGWSPEERRLHLEKIRKLRTFAAPKVKPPMVDRQSPEYRKKRSDIALTRWTDPVFRELMRTKKREFWNSLSPAKRVELAARLKLHAAEASANSQLTNQRPEIREKRVAAQKTAFSTPEAKAKRSQVSRLMWEKRKLQVQ